MKLSSFAPRLILALLMAGCFTALAQTSPTENSLVIPLERGEKLWPAFIREGEHFPCAPGYYRDLYGDNKGNQVQPLLLGSRGLWVWRFNHCPHRSYHVRQGDSPTTLAQFKPVEIFEI